MSSPQLAVVREVFTHRPIHQREVGRTFASRTYDWMRGSPKKSELSREGKEKIFFTAMDRKATSERLETFFNKKNHIAMQNTPPKQENNIISMAHKTENQPFLPQFHKIFRTTTSSYFISPSLVFHTDSISVKIASNIFRDLEILYKI